MIAIEITMLVIGYTLMIMTIFLEVVCYKRNLETIETIAFTISLLFLILTFTISAFIVDPYSSDTTNVVTLLAMILVGLTTILNTLEERQHNLSPYWKKTSVACSILLMLSVVLGYFIGSLSFLQYVVVVFLGVSVVLSMVLIRITKPHPRIAHREKVERVFAAAFIILIPLSLAANYIADLEAANVKIGFTIPLVFILLAGSKFWDDLQRLSLFKVENAIKEQNLKNYSFTKREKEIAKLLAKGITYKQISEELFISMPTVKSHVSNIYKKCNVKTRSELTALLIN